jgi:hypothetical protein
LVIGTAGLLCAAIIPASGRAQFTPGAATINPPMMSPGLQDPITPPLPGQRQHYVPQHFDAQGRYIPPHYEAQKPQAFRGYYDDDMAQRFQNNQHGYTEPPAYDPTPETFPDKRPEGR